MIFVAASRSLALRSFIFAVAISAQLRALDGSGRNLARLLRARLQVGRAFFRRKLAGGVLVVKEKLRSA